MFLLRNNDESNLTNFILKVKLFAQKIIKIFQKIKFIFITQKNIYKIHFTKKYLSIMLHLIFKNFMKLQNIEIFADGSCRGNPGPGGWCAIILEKKSSVPFKILKGNEIFTTNNRMEMLAIIEALKFIIENKLQNLEINLYSDSNLVIQSLNQGWKRKANKDLWEELDELAEGLDVSYIWVKGHAKNKWNNECDKHAQSESLKASKKKPTEKNILKKEKEDPQSTLF